MTTLVAASPAQRAVERLGNRYQLRDPLGSGGMGTVYRAHDQLTGHTVALKRVLRTPLLMADHELRLALTREFQALASLRHPHIIAVQDYGFDARQQPYFIMELLSAARPLTEAASFWGETGKIDLLLQLLQALVYIHRRGIIHRDLKPGNVLLHGQTVKLVDFGLATVAGQGTPPSGTLAYMAPELLRGQPAAPAADLYAVGVLAYELLAGWHPFAHATNMIEAVLHETADFTYLALSPELTAVLQTLLAKEPAHRYADAAATTAALCHAVGRPLPAETEATRDSFLQAAPFIGRAAELDQLQTALAEAQAGRGSGWLLRGESGIGKSRLLQELRTQALVQGVAVLRGQAHADGGPYHLWREWLRPFLLLAQPTDLETAVLHPLVPDIATLLGRPVTPAPQLEAKAARTRLHLTLTDLLRRTSQQQPLLILLEDLHWADEASLDLLRAVAQSLTAVSAFLIGSYRAGERPQLPAQLPTLTPMPLSRLAAPHVADLCQAMLGENGRLPHLVELVQRESEGNTFFIVEVMRTLAEEAGRLDQIGAAVLPTAVFAGGMQQMVQRRLQRITAVYQPVLQTAAIAGRQIDPHLLAFLFPQTNLDDWLTHCANAAVLERPDGGLLWQFSHDKLREGVLLQLDPTVRQQTHLAIAAGLEQCYAAELAPHYTALAHHFGQAGQRAAQIRYLRLAAQQAEAAYANEAALANYQQLLPLLDEPLERAEVLLPLGRLCKLTGAWEAAAGWLEQGMVEITDVELGETAVSLQAQLCHTLGNLERSRSHYAEALRWLGQAQHHYEQQADRVGVCATLVETSNVYYQQGQYAAAQAQLEQTLVAAQQVDDPRSLALVRHNLGSVAYSQTHYAVAQDHFAAALAIRQTLGNKVELADSHNNLGLVAFRRGEAGVAQEHFAQSLVLRRAVGDRWGIAASLNNLGLIPYEQQDYATAETYWAEAVVMRRALGDDWTLAGGLDNLALVAVGQEDVERAAGLLDEAITLRRRLADKPGLAISLGNLGRLLWQQGKWETAVFRYRESLQLAAEVGDRLGVVFPLAGVGAVWVAQGRVETAVSLLAAAEAHLRRINGRWEHHEQQMFEASLTAARQQLSPAVFGAAWEGGRQLSAATAQEMVGM